MGFKSKIVGAIILLAGVLASCHKEPYSQVFSTNEGFLQDANGSEFLIRGVNVPFAWHPVKSYQALDEIARQRANCVRVVWESSLPASGLDSILQKSIDLNMIPIVELHDATGDSTATKLYQMATYFVSDEMKSVIQKYESYLLINIANEWGDNNLKAEYWRDAYKECISLLRNSGYRSTIVIDAPGWGQNSDPVLLYGQALIDYDPLHNLLFSIHMYGSWNDEGKIRHDLQAAVNQSLPIVVGEFGYHFNEGNNNLNCKVNHEQILKVCAELNIGFLAWSWSGNNEVNQWLDLVTNDDWKTLTDWGKAIFNSPLGIKETARKASVFNN